MSIANQSAIIGFTNDSPVSVPTGVSSLGLPPFQLGQVVIAGNNSYTFVLAAADQAAAATFGLTGGFSTAAGSTYTHDVASPGVKSGQYFWAKKVATPF